MRETIKFKKRRKNQKVESNGHVKTFFKNFKNFEFFSWIFKHKMSLQIFMIIDSEENMYFFPVVVVVEKDA